MIRVASLGTQEEIGTKYTPVDIKAITETEWLGDIWARWPGWLKLLAKLAKQIGKHIWSRDKRDMDEWEETGQTALPVGSQ